MCVFIILTGYRTYQIASSWENYSLYKSVSLSAERKTTATVLILNKNVGKSLKQC